MTATQQQLSVAAVEQLDLLLLLTSCHGDVSCQHSSPSSSVGTDRCGAEPGASAVGTRKPRTFAEWDGMGCCYATPARIPVVPGLEIYTLSGAHELQL